METKPDRKKYDKRSSVARRHPGDKKRDSFGKFLASYSFITGGGRNTMFLQVGGEISPDLYRFVQCDIKKCAFDSLKLEQNPQNCD